MQYLGGKYRIAKQLAREINAVRGARPLWDPFCGSLAVSAACGGVGLASDECVALPALYNAVRGGWLPPNRLSEAEYMAARDLPDSDPLKAFAGFGCSFGGKWFAGYARDPKSDRNYAQAAARAVLRDVGLCSGFSFAAVDFLSVEPGPTPYLIYCDPPYAGTTGYKQGPFDYVRFITRIQQWARFTDVLVSEYALPIGVEIFSIERNTELGRNTKGVEKRTERLFRVLPAAGEAVA